MPRSPTKKAKNRARIAAQKAHKEAKRRERDKCDSCPGCGAAVGQRHEPDCPTAQEFLRRNARRLGLPVGILNDGGVGAAAALAAMMTGRKPR